MVAETTFIQALNTDKLSRLLELNQELCSSPNLAAFLSSLAAAASQLTSCEAASILEPDEGGENLRFLVLPWYHREVLRSVKVPVNQSAAGTVYESGKVLVIRDAAGDERTFKDADAVSGFNTRDLAAVPITYQGEKLGVLEVLNKVGEGHYTEEDHIILEALAAQAALAMQNLRLQDKVLKAEEGMAQLEKMKSDFIGIASHELRTPLGLILGHATFLREEIAPQHQAQMDIIVRNSNRLRDIIDKIASMDHIQQGGARLQPHSVSIRRVVEEVMDSFHQEALNKRISLESQVEGDDLGTQGDSSKISIALSNLVQNAIHYSKPEGKVLINAERIPDYIRVSVSDEGIGIPASELGHIFERFYQVESHLTRKHGGIGLGLSVAKVMIEMHGGRIWAESVEGKGSTFTFILPALAEPEHSVGPFIS